MRFFIQAAIGLGSGGGTLTVGLMVERLFFEEWEWWMWGVASLPFIALTICAAWRLRKMDPPATKGDIEGVQNQIEGLGNQFAQQMTLEEAFEKMKPEPFGNSGVRTAVVTPGTVFVKEPGKPIMVNLPVPIAGRGRAHFEAGTADLTAKPPADDD